MDEATLKRLEGHEKKIDAIYVSVEKTRRYFKATLIVTIVTIVLPLIGIVIALPYYLSTLNFAGLGF